MYAIVVDRNDYNPGNTNSKVQMADKYYVNKYLKFSIYSDNNAMDVDANGDIIITGRGSTQMDIMNKAGLIVASQNITVY